MTVSARVRTRFRSLTLIEWLAIAAVLALLAALLVPETQWASSGSLKLPVRVVVKEATSGRPIPDAAVGLIRRFDDTATSAPDDLFPLTRDVHRAVTGPDGVALIEYEFRTGASHRSPVPKSHLRREWAVVLSPGYEAVAVPVGHDAVPTKDLRDQKVLTIPVSLMKPDSHD